MHRFFIGYFCLSGGKSEFFKKCCFLPAFLGCIGGFFFSTVLWGQQKTNDKAIELFSYNAATVRDSLLDELQKASGLHREISIYRDLADLPLTKETASYRYMLFKKAQEAGAEEVMADALNEMTALIIRNKDSVNRYLDLLNSYPQTERIKGAGLYIKMLDAVNSSFKIDQRQYIDSLVTRYKKDRILSTDLYDRILYLTTMGHYIIKVNPEDGVRYLEKALELAESLPEENRYIAIDLKVRLSNLYLTMSDKQEESVQYLMQLIDYSRDKLQEYKKSGRKFKNYDNFYYLTYAKLIFNYQALTREQTAYYLGELQRLARRNPRYAKAYARKELLDIYTLLAGRDYTGALNKIDRIVQDTAVTFVRWPLEDKMLLVAGQLSACEMLDDYRGAYQTQQHWMDLYKQYTARTLSRSVGEYQALYNVAHLKNETSKLALEKQVLLIRSYFILIVLLIAWSLYQYLTLRKVKKLKSELEEQSLKAQESERMKGAFINNMCHEIRTPLNAINGFSELMADRTLDGPTRWEYSKIIRENVSLLVSLMTDLLEVSNLDTLSSDLKTERTDIGKVCRLSLEEFKQSHPFNDKIQYIFEPGGECLADTNEPYLSKVLGCVLSNAYKFTEKGSITVSYKTQPEHSQVRISVTDTGSGIPSGKEEKVFERFVKLEEFKVGNGLGLYISRLIVTLLRGRIFVDPLYKNGTRIVILLPL